MDMIKRLSDGKMVVFFKALSNPHRLALLNRLAECCPPGKVWTGKDIGRPYIGELAKGLDISQPTISHHMKELVRSGIIRTQRRGKCIECWIEPQVLEAISQYFRNLGCCIEETTDSLAINQN